MLVFRKIGLRFIACLVFICGLSTCTSTEEQPPKRILLTSESVERLMGENAPAAKKQLQTHIQRLTVKLLAGNLDSYGAYTQYLDASANVSRARKVLIGLTRMRASFDGLQYKVKCMAGKQPAERYGWIEDHRNINFCRVFEDKVRNTTGWHFHEMSHFRWPHGLGTVDHVYARKDCIDLAQSDPSRAVNTAACYTFFLRAESR